MLRGSQASETRVRRGSLAYTGKEHSPMNRKTLIALLVASSVAALPAWLSAAADKTADAVKPAQATPAPATPAPAKPAASSAQGDEAAWKKIQAVKDPTLD